MTGIAAGDLADEDLRRELAHAHEKRNDIFVTGTADQWSNLVERTRELETEFARRFADEVTDAAQKSGVG